MGDIEKNNVIYTRFEFLWLEILTEFLFQKCTIQLIALPFWENLTEIQIEIYKLKPAATPQFVSIMSFV